MCAGLSYDCALQGSWFTVVKTYWPLCTILKMVITIIITELTGYEDCMCILFWKCAKMEILAPFFIKYENEVTSFSGST
jgi:hypothetical protein